MAKKGEPLEKANIDDLACDKMSLPCAKPAQMLGTPDLFFLTNTRIPDLGRRRKIDADSKYPKTGIHEVVKGLNGQYVRNSPLI